MLRSSPAPGNAVPTSPEPSQPPTSATPQAAALALTFLCSIGTGVVTNGIFFISAQAYGFTRVGNYCLALVLGVSYIVAAGGAGRLMAYLGRLGLSTRTLLGLQLGAMGLLAMLPLVASQGGEPRATWALWVLVGLYSPITGLLWPTVESYVSGGRAGEGLRSALGHFNWVWSSATVLALVMMGPLVKPYPAEMLAVLGVMHLLTIGLLCWFGREPGSHADGHVADAHAVRLLRAFRILLPVSYAVMTVLVPYLPSALATLGVGERWWAPLSAVWHGARVFVFIGLGRWHRWHGAWWPAWASSVLLLGGFALVALSAWSEGIGVGLFVVGLAAFGVGMATIYTAALYYAQEVGATSVHAGGAHEAFIGLGYTVGPAIGLLAAGTVGSGILPERHFEPVVISLVGLGSCVAVLPLLARASRFRAPGTVRASKG